MSHFSRSRTRKFLYQMLYAKHFGNIEHESFMESFFSGVFSSEVDEPYLMEMFELILKHEAFLISLVQKYAPKFDINDMDLSFILPVFIASTEMLYFSEEIPVKVSLNEAVEIAKTYGDETSKKMVNGVLHNIVQNLESIQALGKEFTPPITQKHIFQT